MELSLNKKLLIISHVMKLKSEGMDEEDALKYTSIELGLPYEVVLTINNNILISSK